MKWNIEYFKKIDSTQKYLLKRVEEENLNHYCVWSDYQTMGIGTKGRKWEGKRGNLFFSFVVDLKEFGYVPVEGLSIYFSFLVYKVLKNYRNSVVLKFPNDLYILDKGEFKKVGGVLVNIKKGKIICGIGINTKYNPLIKGEYKSGCLDIKVKNDKILQEILAEIGKKYEWKEVFFNYENILNKDVFKIDKVLYEKLKGKL